MQPRVLVLPRQFLYPVVWVLQYVAYVLLVPALLTMSASVFVLFILLFQDHSQFWVILDTVLVSGGIASDGVIDTARMLLILTLIGVPFGLLLDLVEKLFPRFARFHPGRHLKPALIVYAVVLVPFLFVPQLWVVVPFFWALGTGSIVASHYCTSWASFWRGEAQGKRIF